MKIIIIIPAYNEADSIVSVVQEVIEAGYEYVVVNDGSKDRTLRICEEHGFSVLNLRDNLGIGGAVQSGHKYAREQEFFIDIQFDGDGQHDASFIEELIKPIIDGEADLVVGSRFLSDEGGFRSTFMRRVGITWLSFLIKIFGGIKITDPTSGFRACGPRAIELFCREYPIDYPEPESIVTAIGQGLRVKEVPVMMRERKKGSSSIGRLSSMYYMFKVSLAIFILGITRPSKKR